MAGGDGDALRRMIEDAARIVDAHRRGRAHRARLLARRLALYAVFFPPEAIRVADDMWTVSIDTRALP